MFLHQQNSQLVPILVCFLTEVDDVQEEVNRVLMLLTLETYEEVMPESWSANTYTEWALTMNKNHPPIKGC